MPNAATDIDGGVELLMVGPRTTNVRGPLVAKAPWFGKAGVQLTPVVGVSLTIPTRLWPSYYFYLLYCIILGRSQCATSYPEDLETKVT